MTVRRRDLALALVPAGALLAQAPPPSVASPDQELDAARARLRAMQDALAKQKVSITTEPAFEFHVY